MADERSLVARRIEEIRLAKKMTRRGLGDLIGLSYLQVYRIEKDEVDVSAEMLVTIAEKLDVSPASFYRESKAS